jgi:AcrR family transcriptional regulator
MGPLGETSSTRSLDDRVLDALHVCIERWGIQKVTIDDVANESKISRATIYRLFPGGKEIMFEALRVRNLTEFFQGLRRSLRDADSLLDLTVQVAVYATGELRSDEQLVHMLAAEESTAIRELTVDGLPRIINVASEYVLPYVVKMARLVISHFLAPSPHVDLGDPESAREFFAPLVALIDVPVT